MIAPVRAVASGVDSLYLSARGKVYEPLLAELDAERTAAAGEPTVVVLGSDDRHFILQPHGKRGRAYWLSGADFQIFIGVGGAMPPVSVQLHSAYIHTVGVEAAVADVAAFIGQAVLAGPVFCPSRVDVYADTQGWIPVNDDFPRFTCRASARRLYEEPCQLHHRGRALSGFTFGKSAIVARIYDKSLEMRTTGDDWPQLGWHDMVPSLPVWRVEFQFRRAALTTLGLQTVDDVLRNRQALWQYGTTRWLQLREESDHERTARWPVVAAWEAIAAIEVGSPASPLIRYRIRALDERRLVSGFTGYASSIAAARGAGDIHSALATAGGMVDRYLGDQGRRFVDLVIEKRRRQRTTAGGAIGDRQL